MITSFWWVRHGPTHASGAVGWTDLPADLSDTAAIRRLSLYLPERASVISSDLMRASATADAITNSENRRPHNPNLRELNYGDWDGLPFDEIGKRDPVLSRQIWQDPGDVAPPNGESWNMLSTRVDGAVDDIISQNAGESVVVVAHFAVILTALQRASNMSAKAAFSFKIDNLSVTRLDYLHDANAWRVMGVNHLP